MLSAFSLQHINKKSWTIISHQYEPSDSFDLHSL